MLLLYLVCFITVLHTLYCMIIDRMILYTIYLKRSLYALIFKTALTPEHRILFCWVSTEYQYLFCLLCVIQNYILFSVVFA